MLVKEVDSLKEVVAEKEEAMKNLTDNKMTKESLKKTVNTEELGKRMTVYSDPF